MTREAAIKRLEIWLKCVDCPEDKKCYGKHLETLCEYYDYIEEHAMNEAVKKAIEALEQKPCEDCISRATAILSMKKLYEQDCKDYGCEISECFDADRAIRELKSLPSVQTKITVFS